MEQVSVRGVNFDNADPAWQARRAAATKALTISESAFVNAAGCGYPSAKGMALGATGVQPPLDSGTIPEPSQGRIVLPFRPACAS